MKTKNWHTYAKSHNLFNRIIDMLEYYDFFKKSNNVNFAKDQIEIKLSDIVFVESLSVYFEKKLKRYPENKELRCNLYDLINDLIFTLDYTSFTVVLSFFHSS